MTLRRWVILGRLRRISVPHFSECYSCCQEANDHQICFEAKVCNGKDSGKSRDIYYQTPEDVQV
jgi:hypothetical protein